MGLREGDTSTHPKESTRDRLLRLQDAATDLLPVSDWPRLHKCRREPIGPNRRIEIRQGRWGTYAYGLQSCGSAWVCPVCARQVLSGYKAELWAAAQKWSERGGRLVLVTLTIRHTGDMPLEVGLGALLTAYRLSGTTPRLRRRKELGVDGMVTSLEIAHNGAAGWHPHMHQLLFVRPNVTDADLTELWTSLNIAWCACVRETGIEGLYANEQGFDAQIINAEAASYITKIPLAEHESGTRSPWKLLAEYQDDDDLAAGELFQEYARTSLSLLKGKRPVRWTPRFRAELGLGERGNHKKKTTQARSNDDKVIAAFDRAEWQKLRRAGVPRSTLLRGP